MTEPMLLGCPHCGEDVVFEGDRWEAVGECKNCGTVTVCPDELHYYDAAEARGDAQRDGDL